MLLAGIEAARPFVLQFIIILANSEDAILFLCLFPCMHRMHIAPADEMLAFDVVALHRGREPVGILIYNYV